MISIVADERIITPHSYMLIHQLSSGCWGKFSEIEDEFNNLKITRDFSNNIILSDWVYKPINESKRIAGIIKERIIQEHR